MKVAITGASGHIGNCLTREIIKRGDKVKALVHTFANDLEELGAEIIDGDILNPGSLKDLCHGVDVVFHLAARITISNRNAKQTHKININGTQNILDAAKAARVKKFIHFSSIHAHQVNPPDAVLDETRALTENENIVYEYTKAQSEKLVQKATSQNFETVVINPTAVIGPYDFRNSFLGQALRMIYKNKLPLLIKGGYNWVDVRDVVEASIAAMNKGRSGEKYILAGSYCSLKELSEQVAELAHKKTPTMVAPVALARLACPFFEIYARISGKDPLYTSQSLDILAHSPKNISFEKAAKALDYSPRPLKETLRDTFAWYKLQGLL